MDTRALIEARLRAYIHPNIPESEAQQDAFRRAVDAQAEFEAGSQSDPVPGNVKGFSIGNYSVNFENSSGGAYSAATLCPAAYAILFNAGLLSREWPVARRI